MLARTVHARETRDIDIMRTTPDLYETLEELKRLAVIDLDDYFTFEFQTADPIKATEEYRDGLAVKFAVYCGTQAMGFLNIDLVFDPTFRGTPKKVTPSARLVVGDLPVFDYLIYPIEHVIADKVCATFETHNGFPSSRVKDLVDLGIVALSEEVDGSSACIQLAAEFKIRRLDTPAAFAIPPSWQTDHRKAVKSAIGQTDYSNQLIDVDTCFEIVRHFVDPLLDHSASGCIWDPSVQRWNNPNRRGPSIDTHIVR